MTTIKDLQQVKDGLDSIRKAVETTQELLKDKIDSPDTKEEDKQKLLDSYEELKDSLKILNSYTIDKFKRDKEVL